MNHFYKINSALMDYPTEELIQSLPDIHNALPALPASTGKWINDFLHDWQHKPLAQLQEEYVSTFDRGAVPLHLFHYVHGDTKDRGAAMVALREQYANAGLMFGVSEKGENSNRELPDFLPVYVEYLSALSALERKDALSDVSHLLSAIASSLHTLGSVYYLLVASLVLEAGGELPKEKFVVSEQAPEFSEKLMQEVEAKWEEEPAFANNNIDKTSGTDKSPTEHPISFS